MKSFVARDKSIVRKPDDQQHKQICVEDERLAQGSRDFAVAHFHDVIIVSSNHQHFVNPLPAQQHLSLSP